MGQEGDLIDMLSRMRGERGPKKGESVHHTIEVSLEEIFSGVTKKLKVRRQCIDQSQVKPCPACNGAGATMQQVQTPMGMMMAQAACSKCNGQGSEFTSKVEAETLELMVPPGAPDGHKVIFRGKGDDIPGGEAGDVVVTIKEKPHAEFKRRGADLFVTRPLSLLEALTGWKMELTKLDGRTLVVKSAPGQVTVPSAFDPFSHPEEPQEWEAIPDTGCSLPDAARASSADPDVLKEALSRGQLQGRGIGCFVVQDGAATFKVATRDEALQATTKSPGATMYILQDPTVAAAGRLMHAVEGEGLPLMRDPCESGNLFIVFKLQMPDAVSEEAAQALKQVLPPALHSSGADEMAEDVDVGEVGAKDPVASYKEGVFTMHSSLDEDEEAPGGCAQM